MKKTVKVVGAIIINECDEVLCALRSPKMSLPNYWEFPGGKIEPGESREEALKREIYEEFHAEIKVRRIGDGSGTSLSRERREAVLL